MNKIISLFNFKNGVGKTTIAYNLHHFLQCPVYEIEDDFFSYFIQKNEILVQESYKHDYDGKTIQAGVYDINSDNLKKISPILSKSNYVIIPTGVDFKDLVKTVVSINYLRSINEKCKIIILFNRLDPSYKIAEGRFTQVAVDFIKDKVNLHKIEFGYIRNNRTWFQLNVEGQTFFDFSFNKENNTYFKNNAYFSNYQLLEMMYQFCYHKDSFKVPKETKSLMDSEGSINEPVQEDNETEDFISVANIKLFHKEDTFIREVLKIDDLRYIVQGEYNLEKEENIDEIMKEIKEKKLHIIKNRNNIYAFLFKLVFSEKETSYRKKVVKDLRNLLIQLDEYSSAHF